MTWEVGQRVFIKKMKQNGIIQSVQQGGKYRVECNHLVVVCRLNELEAARDLPSSHPKSETAIFDNPTLAGRSSGRSKGRSRTQYETIDLHGMRVDEALQLLAEHIDSAILAQVDRIRIIHGIGSGALKDGLDKFLPTLGVVRNIRPDSQNPGVTWVYL